MNVVRIVAAAVVGCFALAACQNSPQADPAERPVESSREAEREAFEFMVQTRIDEIDESIPAIRESLVAMDQATKSTVFLEINEILQLRDTLEANLEELSVLPDDEAAELEAEMRALLGDIEQRFQEIHALLGPSAFSPASQDPNGP